MGVQLEQQAEALKNNYQPVCQKRAAIAVNLTSLKRWIWTKNPSNRKSTKKGPKPNGGQPGHKGHTLIASDSPDQTRDHQIPPCEHCHASLKEVNARDSEDRQVFEIPARRIEVTAPRAEMKIGPRCGHKNPGDFPVGVTQPVQYGNGVKTWASSFYNPHLIPVERTRCPNF